MSQPEWLKAMQDELTALHDNRKWSLTDLPAGKKASRCKWVFTLKLKTDGSIERYKARLVAKGYNQTACVDSEETFSPISKLNTVKLMISIATTYNWDLHQLDVKNAFLRGDLQDEVHDAATWVYC